MREYRDLQLLLYVPVEQYESCIHFYETVFQVESFYGWEENENDRGKKYDIAGTKIVILTQENPFPEYGPMHYQIEVDDVDAMYAHVTACAPDCITQHPFHRSYGWHMFRIVDPAGNHINLYRP